MNAMPHVCSWFAHPAPTINPDLDPKVRDALLQQRAWVLHWIDDVAGNLKPTESSLLTALGQINVALSRQAAE